MRFGFDADGLEVVFLWSFRSFVLLSLLLLSGVLVK